MSKTEVWERERRELTCDRHNKDGVDSVYRQVRLDEFSTLE